MAIAKVTCVARHNNYVGFNNIKLQIPADQHDVTTWRQRWLHYAL